MSTVETQKRFVTALAGTVPPGWTALHVHFEYATVDGETFEKFVAKRTDAQGQSQFQLPLDVLDILIEMNDDIPEGQSEKWTAVDVSVEPSGKFRFDFHYGVPPLVAETLQRQQA